MNLAGRLNLSPAAFATCCIVLSIALPLGWAGVLSLGSKPLDVPLSGLPRDSGDAEFRVGWPGVYAVDVAVSVTGDVATRRKVACLLGAWSETECGGVIPGIDFSWQLRALDGSLVRDSTGNLIPGGVVSGGSAGGASAVGRWRVRSADSAPGRGRGIHYRGTNVAQARSWPLFDLASSSGSLAR